MNNTDHVGDARAFVDNLPNDDGYISGYTRNGVQYRLMAEGLRALLDEVEQLRARQVGDNHVFVSGWYAHAEACASLGWDVREAAWRKYREEMAETLSRYSPIVGHDGIHGPTKPARDGEVER